MSADHFHPVWLSRELRRDPVKIQFLGQELVLFRGDDGRVGALVDRCPHRAMRLSAGAVRQGRLVCPYHGWSYAPDGEGRCPAAPSLAVTAPGFEAVERNSAIWLRPRGSSAPFPHFEVDDFPRVGELRHEIAAPLELVLDNFIEVEHTGITHAFLGYPSDRMDEVESELRLSEQSVRVINRGPQRKLPPGLGRLMGIERDDLFIDDWTTWFSPVYTVYDHFWVSPEGTRRPASFRIYVFFTPMDENRTALHSFVFAQRPAWGRYAEPLLRRFSLALVNLEITLDQRMIAQLADKSPALTGKLGRFDRALVEARKRLARIYRLQPGSVADNTGF